MFHIGIISGYPMLSRGKGSTKYASEYIGMCKYKSRKWYVIIRLSNTTKQKIKHEPF